MPPDESVCVFAVIGDKRDAEHSDLHAIDSGRIPFRDTRKRLSGRLEAIRRRPLELRARHACKQCVSIELELVIAQRCVVELRSVELLPHLLASIPFAQETRRHEIAGEDERYRACFCERVAEPCDTRQSARAVAEGIPEVHVVDEKKTKRPRRWFGSDGGSRNCCGSGCNSAPAPDSR